MSTSISVIAQADAETTDPVLERAVSHVPTLSKKRAIAGIVSASIIGNVLGVTPAQAAWIASSYPLTQGTCVLVSGRLGAVFGHKNLLTIECTWWVFWNMATAAYGGTIISVSIMRALAGIGGGLIVPNAVALLTITFPPGKRRNLSLALFASMGPVGGTGGCFIVGIFIQWLHWTWLFFFLATLGLIVYGIAIIVIEQDLPLDPTGSIDWVGSYLALGGLILFNIVWNQAPVVGWDEPYEHILLIIAILHFAPFILWEAKYAKVPILPVDLWKAPSSQCHYCAVFLLNIRNFSAVLLGCAWIPMAIFGVGAAFLAAWAVPRMPAQILVAVGCVGAAATNDLLATTPVHQTYWAMFLPAMILVAFTGDMVFAAGQIIASSGVARRYQGAAGSLISMLFTYGMRTGLGFAGTVERYSNPDCTNLLKGYRAAVYLGISFAVGGLIIDLLFVQMKKNTTEGWQGEDAELNK
ncbi:MFS general substrate transporter [Trichoderma evansii]